VTKGLTATVGVVSPAVAFLVQSESIAVLFVTVPVGKEWKAAIPVMDGPFGWIAFGASLLLLAANAAAAFYVKPALRPPEIGLMLLASIAFGSVALHLVANTAVSLGGYNDGSSVQVLASIANVTPTCAVFCVAWSAASVVNRRLARSNAMSR
jgi:hypothetical protein